MGLGAGAQVACASAAPGPLPPLATLGPLGEPDAQGIRLPAGLRSRVVAVAGQRPVRRASNLWHNYPDGGATFSKPDGGWVYVSNCEVPLAGGASALHFNAAGDVLDARRLLLGTSLNCAGGATPWGTWLSGEEFPQGQVWEVAPLGSHRDARARPALGTFQHEAVAVDPQARVLYLTEDDGAGRFYRFVCSPTDWPEGAARPALAQGRLQVMKLVDVPAGQYPGSQLDLSQPRAVVWQDVVQAQSPQKVVRARLGAQAPGTVFKGGEGLWFFGGMVYFSTKGDDRIWAYDRSREMVEVIYDFARAMAPDNALSGVDNLTVSPWGDVLVAEDGGNMELCLLHPNGLARPLLQVLGQEGSEITGPAFSPDGRRLYFSSQRGGPLKLGITYEISWA